MSTFKSLYYYETKKLWSRKIVQISLGICLVLLAFAVFAPTFTYYYIDGEKQHTIYEEEKLDQSYAKALNGRSIDQQLLEETMEAYRKIEETPGKHYMGTTDYQKYARSYREIFQFVAGNIDEADSEIISSWEPSEEDLYRQRNLCLEEDWKNMRLSPAETAFWQQRENKIKTPYIYQEHISYDKLISNFQTIGLMVLLLIAIALSGIFSEEHRRRTDQLLLSSAKGKSVLYRAKLLAGLSFAAEITLLFFGFSCLFTFLLYGTHGFEAAFQFIYRSSCDPISCGQAVLIAYAAMLVTALFTAVIVMLCSELLRSSLATLALSVGFLLAAMIVVIPQQYRLLSQLWNWLPCSFLSVWNVFGRYTLSVFGRHFTTWQAVPALYLIGGSIVAALGKPLYRRYQISGR